MRGAERLTLNNPPASQVIWIPGCAALKRSLNYSWKDFETVLHRAIDFAFVARDDPASPEVPQKSAM